LNSTGAAAWQPSVDLGGMVVGAVEAGVAASRVAVFAACTQSSRKSASRVAESVHHVTDEKEMGLDAEQPVACHRSVLLAERTGSKDVQAIIAQAARGAVESSRNVRRSHGNPATEQLPGGESLGSTAIQHVPPLRSHERAPIHVELHITCDAAFVRVSLRIWRPHSRAVGAAELTHAELLTSDLTRQFDGGNTDAAALPGVAAVEGLMLCNSASGEHRAPSRHVDSSNLLDKWPAQPLQIAPELSTRSLGCKGTLVLGSQLSEPALLQGPILISHTHASSHLPGASKSVLCSHTAQLSSTVSPKCQHSHKHSAPLKVALDASW